MARRKCATWARKGASCLSPLIQTVYFQAQLDVLQALTNRIADINVEVEAIKDEFTEEEQETYFDSEKEGVLDKKRITPMPNQV